MAGLRPCAVPGCPTLSEDTHCPAHAQPAHLGWRADTERIRGRRLQALRARLFAAEPFCRLCKAQGRRRLATIRDHIVPLAEGGTDEPSNVQPLCAACSDDKTRAEAKRGRQRDG